MKLFYTIILIFLYAPIQAQFSVDNGTQIFIKGSTKLYTDIKFINKGDVTFSTSATGGLIIDAGLDNSIGTLTLNNAILHLGSDSPRAGENHDLVFGNNDTFKFVELGKTSGTYSVTGGLLNITNTFTSNSGTLEADNKVILKSSSVLNTAIVPESSVGTINGIRIERFIPAKRAWRFMASSVSTDDFIFENWQQAGLNSGDIGYRNHIGTHITGGTIANGFDQSGTNNPSMYTFDVANQQWNAVLNTKTKALENSEAYLTLIRGDRSTNLMTNDTNETETTLEQVGSLHIGSKDQSFSTPSGGSFVATANPYQAPVDMNQVIGASNTFFKNQIWIWVQTDFTTGQYVIIDDLANPTPNVTGSNVTQNLQPGQSGFIQTNDAISGTVTLTYNEARKVGQDSLTETFSEHNKSSSNLDGFLRIGLYNINSIPFTDVAYDGVIVRFDDQYNNLIDDFDGMKLFNNEENLAVSLDATYLSVNNRKLPDTLDEVIDLSLFNLDDSQYVFSIELGGLTTLSNGILLWDRYLNTYTTLTDQDLIYFDIDVSIPESFTENRFALVFENQTLGVEDQIFSTISIYPNPVVNERLTIQFSELFIGIKTEIEIFSLDGKLIRKQIFENIEDKIHLYDLDFATGIYMLKVKQANTNKTFKIIKP